MIDSVNIANGSLEEFHASLGGESHWKELARIRWKDAIHDPNQLRRAGKETVKTVATKGADVVAVAVAVVGLLYAAASAGGENNDSENSSGDDPEGSTDDESEESWDDE